MAEWILTQDVEAIARAAWEKHGRTPNELFGDLTPSQFVALYTKPPAAELDRVDAVTKHNRERGRRGLRPVVPTWL